jgi:hypothetical protein
MTVTAGTARGDVDRRKEGAIAALYLSLAPLAAIPYFLAMLDLPRRGRLDD